MRKFFSVLSFKFAAAFIPALLLVGCGGYYGPGNGGWDHMMYFGYGFGGMFMWLLFIIAVIIIAYLIIKNAKAKTPGGVREEKPLDILKKRYAKGEITKEEYDRMKSDLEV